MKKQELEEIIACLSRDRTLYYYCKDRYVASLLRYFFSTGVSVGEIKRSQAAQLLRKPAVQQYLSRWGSGFLSTEGMDAFWPHEAEAFILTVGKWGDGSWGWDQTSRPGYNLVLHLNLSEKHNRAFRRLLRPKQDGLFNGCGHPTLQRGERDYFRETLAWARIDLDFSSNEALIEEIQTDWVRGAHRLLDCAERGHFPRFLANRINCKHEDVILYVQEVLDKYANVWDEAMLSATIHFIREELGISNVYYHTFETGRVLKRIRWTQPPRSLYTKLPRRFCFEQVDDVPTFLKKERVVRRSLKKLVKPASFRLQLH